MTGVVVGVHADAMVTVSGGRADAKPTASMRVWAMRTDSRQSALCLWRHTSMLIGAM